MRLGRLVGSLALVLLCGMARAEEGPIVRAALVAERAALVAGDANWIALRLRMREGWHVYWQNPGDSGLPPRMAWRLPAGVSVSDFQWPAPERLPIGPLANYGYAGEVLLPMQVTVAGGPGSTVALTGTAKWLACKVDCIPEQADVALTLPVVAGAPADGAAADAVRAALAAVPQAAPGWSGILASEGERTLVLQATTPPSFDAHAFTYLFFPDEGGVIEPAAAQPASVDGASVTLRLARAATATAPVETLRGVLVARPRAAGTPPAAIEIEARFAPPAPRATMGIAAALGLAFLGGLLLNLMPCVFPVLAIKVMGFARHAGERRATAVVHALVFAAGVVTSFLALAGVLLALRAGGAEIGWGFQLQSPTIVLALAFLFFGIAMVLLGVVHVGSRITAAAGGVRPRDGVVGSFLSGALATAVATPCTAPFMGTALGWALVAPPAAALGVFAALGLGMGVPYVVLAASPALERALPRPGPWMETLQQALAFPMLATVVWLLWVFGRQTGTGGQVTALAGLLLAGFGCWVAGRFAVPVASASHRWAAGLVALLAITGGFAVALPSGEPQPAAADVAGDVAWEPYSAERLAALQTEGRPVWLEFTAAWCITCQVNERVVFGSAAVRDAFRRLRVVPMRADWTSQSSAISRALAGFGRSGVPLAVLYGADPAVPPMVQPTILTPATVLASLETLSPERRP